MMQAENRIQIPIEIRQHLKLEPGKFLRIKIEGVTIWSPRGEEFFAKISTDGRITVPWEIRWKLEIEPGHVTRIFLYTED